MIYYTIFAFLVWAGLLSLLCAEQRASLDGWGNFFKLAGLSLLTTAFAAAILAIFVSHALT